MTYLTSGTSAYELLAREYYDSRLHPTCANLREASKVLIRDWFRKFVDNAPVCEIGAGRSVAAELLLEMQRPLSDLCLTDSVSAMLDYSKKWESAVAKAIVADAADLPYAAGSFDLCVASLGDPYNQPGFWSELARVMSAHAHAIFTTPSYEWASRYRADPSDEASSFSAEFLLADGSTIHAPSMVFQREEQVRLIEGAGTLEVIDFRQFTFSQLSSDSISPKLLVARDADLPIATGYLIRKR